MITTYNVAYPHPEIPSYRTIRPVGLVPDARRAVLIENLIAAYPSHSNDLRAADVWMVSRSSNGLTPTLTGTTGLQSPYHRRGWWPQECVTTMDQPKRGKRKKYQRI